MCLVSLVVPAAVRGAAPIDEETSSTLVAPGTVNTVVEVPASSVDKWELKSDDSDPLEVLVLGAAVPCANRLPSRTCGASPS